MEEFKEIILIDENYLPELLADINNAKQTIDMEVYIFANDLAGQMVTDALCKATHRNVKIRILVDGVGSLSWGGNMTNQLEHAGIATKIFHPLPWKFLHWKYANHISGFFISKIFYLIAKINSRNHRKVCIIDKTIVYIGSANINDHLISGDIPGNCWRDTTVKIIGMDLNGIQYAFDRAWGHVTIKRFILNAFKKIVSDPVVRFNYSWRLRHKFYKLLLNRIKHCKKKIWVTNSYFVPDSYLLKKLIKASRMGVDVRIILPRRSDIFFMPIVSATFYEKLLKSGVLIYEYLPTVLHAKMLIIDNWYSIGSSNLNYRSLKHDLEVDVEIRTEKGKQIIEQNFLNNINQSFQINMSDIKTQSLFKKVFGQFLLFMRHWL